MNSKIVYKILTICLRGDDKHGGRQALLIGFVINKKNKTLNIKCMTTNPGPVAVKGNPFEEGAVQYISGK